MTQTYKQPGQPKGSIGRLLGWVMSWYNQLDNEWTLNLLEIVNGQKLLEVGFGPGKAIQTAHVRYPECYISGVDHSNTMVEMATKLNSKAISEGKVQLGVGDVSNLTFTDNSFDAAFSINCIYFWPDPVHALEEIRRVLKQGGQLAITVRDKQTKAYQSFSESRLEKLLYDAGFKNVSIHNNGLSSHPLLCVIGFKL